MSNGDWSRLAGAISQRIEDLGITQAQIQQAGGPSPAKVREIISGRSTSLSPSKRRDLERALDWMYGSIDDVLTGLDPTPVPPGTPDEPDLDHLASSDTWRYAEIKEWAQSEMWLAADDLATEISRIDASPSLREAAVAVTSALAITLGEVLISAGNDGRLTPPQRADLLLDLYGRRTSTIAKIGEVDDVSSDDGESVPDGWGRFGDPGADRSEDAEQDPELG